MPVQLKGKSAIIQCMSIRTRFRNISDSEAHWIFDIGREAVRIFFWIFGRWWKGADEWRKWEVRSGLAFLVSGIPTVGVVVAGVLLMSSYHIPMNDSLGAPTGEIISVILVSGITLVVAGRRVYRELEKHVD